MTQLEILNLACDAALTKWGYYHDRIERLKEKGETNELFEAREKEWSRKIREISGMIIREWPQGRREKCTKQLRK